MGKVFCSFSSETFCCHWQLFSELVIGWLIPQSCVWLLLPLHDAQLHILMSCFLEILLLCSWSKWAAPWRWGGPLDERSLLQKMVPCNPGRVFEIQQKCQAQICIQRHSKGSKAPDIWAPCVPPCWKIFTTCWFLAWDGMCKTLSVCVELTNFIQHLCKAMDHSKAQEIQVFEVTNMIGRFRRNP